MLRAQYLENYLRLQIWYAALYRGCLAGAQINFPESERGLGHVTPIIFGSTVGYPSDSLASCVVSVNPMLLILFGHASHTQKNTEAIVRTRDKGIIILSLPPCYLFYLLCGPIGATLTVASCSSVSPSVKCLRFSRRNSKVVETSNLVET